MTKEELIQVIQKLIENNDFHKFEVLHIQYLGTEESYDRRNNITSLCYHYLLTCKMGGLLCQFICNATIEYWNLPLILTFDEAKQFLQFKMKFLDKVSYAINRYMEEHSLYREDIEEGIKCSLL